MATACSPATWIFVFFIAPIFARKIGAMPELPDVCVYLEALTRHVVGQRLERITVASPFVLRSYDPPVDALAGREVRAVRRLGKRIVLEFGDGLFLVIHLMIAGRLRWRAPGQKLGMGAKMILATLHFPTGTLYFTEAGDGFPEKVTAFHDEMAVHGRFRKPCPVCGSPVQRIVYAENECNYCARCQTGGRLLADRSLSRLLKDDWPKSIDDL